MSFYSRNHELLHSFELRTDRQVAPTTNGTEASGSNPLCRAVMG